MATVRCFEDLVCWKKARELANFVYRITDIPTFRDSDLKRQMRRAVVSVMSNIGEGFDRGTKNEFVDALYIAKGECGEVRSQLYLASDLRYIDMSIYRDGLGLTDACSRLIQSFATKVKGDGASGAQFKHVPPTDKTERFLREHAPEVHKRLYSVA